jgi:hypothetical protein
MLILASCVFFWLVVGHALADYSLQSDTMAIGKNRNLEGGCYRTVPWYYWMAAHSLIHGGVVGLFTGWIVLGVIETLAHYIIDCAKCEKCINVHVDQFLHIACKIGYACWMAYIVTSGPAIGL